MNNDIVVKTVTVRIKGTAPLIVHKWSIREKVRKYPAIRSKKTAGAVE